MRRPWVVPVAVVGVVVLGVLLALFQPWQLFIDTEVNEDLPVAAVDTTAPPTTAPPTTAAGPADPAGDPAAETTTTTAPPTTAPPAPPEPVVLASGDFTSIEHTTTGQAVIVELADGRRFLRFENLQTDNGPDLQVYLSAAPADGPADALDDDFVDLGALKGNLGNQNYEIPADVDLSTIRSATIWCRRFSVGFGVAPVVPA